MVFSPRRFNYSRRETKETLLLWGLTGLALLLTIGGYFLFVPVKYRASAQIFLKEDIWGEHLLVEVNPKIVGNRLFRQSEFEIIQSPTFLLRVLSKLPFVDRDKSQDRAQIQDLTERIRLKKYPNGYVDILATHHKPQLAVMIANTVAQTYYREKKEHKYDKLLEAIDSWEQKIAQQIDRIFEAKKLLQEAKQRVEGGWEAKIENTRSSINKLVGEEKALLQSSSQESGDFATVDEYQRFLLRNKMARIENEVFQGLPNSSDNNAYEKLLRAEHNLLLQRQALDDLFREMAESNAPSAPIFYVEIVKPATTEQAEPVSRWLPALLLGLLIGVATWIASKNYL